MVYVIILIKFSPRKIAILRSKSKNLPVTQLQTPGQAQKSSFFEALTDVPVPDFEAAEK
jgi:hypothetical protein